ncbi:MAG: winged helix-turn-helix transcriptional regulator [Pedobacter sp.]|nr:winged helix-turn-helix transcriptional regulator [Chitinophagaceae bacterium]
MSIDKSSAFTQEEQDLSAFAKAIAHPARIAILKILAAKNACICGEIVEVLPLAQATVSQHLKALKEAGLISGTIEGSKSCYCINWVAFNNFKTQFNFLFSSLKLSKKQCC